MTPRHQSSIVVPGLLAVALMMAGCQDSRTPTAGRPNFWGGQQLCPTGKFTGGGRIDPPHPDVADGASGSSTLVGKLTFGFNVFLGTDAAGNCIVTKGEIQVVHHQPLFPFQVMWHIAIHNGANAIDGSEVPASTFADGRGGLCVVVGPTAARIDEVTLGSSGSEQTRMTACDNGEPGSSPGFGPDSFRWESQNFGDTDLTLLTGGNIQAH